MHEQPPVEPPVSCPKGGVKLRPDRRRPAFSTFLSSGRPFASTALSLSLETPERPPVLAELARRLSNSAVAWSWGFNALRLASGLLLFPLLLRKLSASDLGMYAVFISLNGIVPVLDLGFAPTIGRFISYAMGGATRLSAHGVPAGECRGAPNLALLWELLATARMFYRFVTLATFVLLGTAGSFLVWQKVAETSAPHFTWLSWGVSVLAVCAECYFNFWNVFLRNMNRVLVAARIEVLAYALRLPLACALLLMGGGLLSLPLASLLTSLVIRNASRRRCLAALADCPAPAHVDWRAHFRALWPNSWRLGLYLVGGYLSVNANVLICAMVFGLAANADYYLSTQVITIVGGMAAVWTGVKWPVIGQHIARQEREPLRRVFWPRLWLHLGTFAVLVAGAIAFGPWLIRAAGKDKQMLPLFWMTLLAVNGLLEQHLSVWNTLIAMGNRLPMLWPSLATNAAGLALNLFLVTRPDAVPGVLALGPLAAGLVFNYWFWPRYGARTLGLGWLQFARSGFARLRPSGA